MTRVCDWNVFSLCVSNPMCVWLPQSQHLLLLITSSWVIGKRFTRGELIERGETVLVCGRHVTTDGLILLRTSEGWMQEQLPATQISSIKIFLQPQADERIMGVKVTRWGIADPLPRRFGSFLFNPVLKKFRFVFHIDLVYAKSKVIKVVRNLRDIRLMRDAILSSNQASKLTLLAYPAYSLGEGQEEFLEDIQALNQFVEDIEEWLLGVVKKVSFVSCQVLKEFLTPTEQDIRNMDVELMATNGLGGAFATEMKYDRT